MSRDEGAAFAKENGLIFLETSAKTAANVEEVGAPRLVCGATTYAPIRHDTLCLSSVQAFVKTAQKVHDNIESGVCDLSNEAHGIKLGVSAGAGSGAGAGTGGGGGKPDTGKPGCCN